MTFVVDASVALKWFVDEDGHETARDLFGEGRKLLAPSLIYAELTNIFWRKQMKRESDAVQAATALLSLPALLDGVRDIAPLAQPALDAAVAIGHPVYDCFYLACALAEGGQFVTADARFVSAVADTVYRDSVLALATL